MGSIKDRNGKDLTEAEEIKKRWQEYMEELYKKGLNDLENHYGVVIYLEPYIPEWEIKSRTLGSITRDFLIMMKEPNPIGVKNQNSTVLCTHIHFSSRKSEITREHFMQRWAQ